MARPLRARIDDVARGLGVPLPVVEKDYAISYVLAGIARQAILERTLVFKGGTALKKLIFGDYRFSEDLDFTALDAPQGSELEKALGEALAESRRLLASQGPFALSLERYVERDPHPGGQEAFVARVQFPWHPTPLCRVKLEVTLDEPVLLPPEGRPLIHLPGVTFLQRDLLRDAPPEGEFDLVIATWVFEHLKGRGGEVLAKAWERLKPGGHVVLLTYSRPNSWLDPLAKAIGRLVLAEPTPEEAYLALPGRVALRRFLGGLATLLVLRKEGAIHG